MKLKNELQPIRDWAENKGIYEKGDVKTQTIKLFEEAGELSKHRQYFDTFFTIK